MSAPFRVGSPFDLLRIIPVVLDFVPEDDVVTLAISGGRMVMTARIDLNLPESIALTEAAGVANAVTNAGADAVMLVRYCTTTDDRSGISDSIALHLLTDDVPVWLNVTVSGSQFDGTAVYTIDGDPTVHHAPTLNDLPARPGGNARRRRDDVARTIEPGPRAAVISSRVAALRTAHTPVEVPVAAALWQRILTEPTATLPDEDVAAAVHALHDPDVLDRVMMGDPQTPATVEGLRARLVADSTRVERLTELAACLTDAEAAPVLECLAVTAYAHGLGTLFNLTSERLTHITRPQHSLTVLALEFARAGLDPAAVLP